MRLAAILLAMTVVGPVLALEPKQIAIVYNRNLAASKDVAEHYRKKRNVPAEQLIALDLPTDEEITREDYNNKLLYPLRDALRPWKDQVTCLLMIHGVPLRVGPKIPTDSEKKELEALVKEIEALQKKSDPEIKLAINIKNRRKSLLGHAESQAAVDSELMLLWHPSYPLERWQLNPLNWQFPAERRKELPPTLMTARLDGPSPAIARRLVDDACQVEAKGLEGKIYIDARGYSFDPKGNDSGHGYSGYDESMRETARMFKRAGMDVTLDNRNELFASQSCPEAAIYCGWYALMNFQDCCKFVPGAVAWHLASGGAVTLRNDTPKAWCPNLLKAGVAATLGPVAEPYTVGFPKPEEFFGFLATGKYTLAEVHARTQYFSSWMTVLVGDPLYNPYKLKPRLKESDVITSPVGGKNLFDTVRMKR